MDALQRRALSEQLADSLRRPLPEYTARRVFGRLWFAGKATAVTGIRRAGKTAFLHRMRRGLVERGVPRERLPYLSFEDERLVGLDARGLGLAVEEYYRRFPDLRGVEVTWCFDEVQMVAGWERFVRRLLDTERVRVFVTGSSAALLSREIATAIRGRAWQVVMHPFSFEEALRHRRQPVPAEPDFLAPRERSQVERALLDWLQAGGFPEAQGLGLIPLFDRTGRANVGHALETAVLVELERRRYDVTYVRSREGYEVDFLARRAGGEAELIQVCADLSDAATANRELRALAAAGAMFPRAGKRLLTLVHDGIPDDLPAGVVAQPAGEWLLAPPGE